MCGGLFSKPKTPEVKKVDPVPTAVTNTDTQTQGAESEANKEQRRKRGYAYNQLSKDRDTIVGGSGKKTLG